MELNKFPIIKVIIYVDAAVTTTMMTTIALHHAFVVSLNFINAHVGVKCMSPGEQV